MLEELGVPYDLWFVDIMRGEQKTPAVLALNPMGKLPILVDGDAVVTESAAIGIYLADRYSLGRLARQQTMADVIFGGTLRYMRFASRCLSRARAALLGDGEGSAPQPAAGRDGPAFVTYVDRLGERLPFRCRPLGHTLRLRTRKVPSHSPREHLCKT